MKVKRLLASFLAASLTFSMSATAFAANVKPGGEGAKGEYEFSKDTVFFNVKGDVRDIYDVNADTGLKKKIGTFEGATEYFVSKDTDFDALLISTADFISPLSPSRSSESANWIPASF